MNIEVSNPICFRVDVLAGSPDEINRIEARLKKPSTGLIKWVAEKSKQPESEVAADLAQLVSFRRVKNLFYTHESVNKARRFENDSNTRSATLVYDHLCEVSEEYPNAVFLVAYCDPQYSYSGKKVLRAGEVVKEIFNENPRAQALDWALLDIFAPFLAEWDRGLEFGSLWKEWVEEIAAAVEHLRNMPEIREANEDVTEDDVRSNVVSEDTSVAGEAS